MRYKVYKLTFTSGIHIGNGTLPSSAAAIHADTLFSAMCIEALNIGGEELLDELVSNAKENRLRISDALPYIADTLYLPKPMCRAEKSAEDPALKKEFKKMTYIPSGKMREYLAGELDPIAVNRELALLGKGSLYQKVSIKEDADNELYTIGVYEFNKDCGLYVIIGFEDEETDWLIGDIFDALQYSGLGGKRTSGFGRFSAGVRALDSDLERALTCSGDRYMSLSVSMAKTDELESLLEKQETAYTLIKRGGFVQSASYSDKPLKKRDLYMFAPGAVFGSAFDGDVFDVAKDGAHAVYRYAKPMLMSI
ncbi:MAG: type III-A CRISPR-associated RAMP protein Csm4 [Firmicutes bacterium]|nr:type III-A CRISPR-associated RAMP protein Csm4 [Bacillota bacterium]